jgi:hypothetical protein
MTLETMGSTLMCAASVLLFASVGEIFVTQAWHRLLASRLAEIPTPETTTVGTFRDAHVPVADDVTLAPFGMVVRAGRLTYAAPTSPVMETVRLTLLLWLALGFLMLCVSQIGWTLPAALAILALLPPIVLARRIVRRQPPREPELEVDASTRHIIARVAIVPWNFSFDDIAQVRLVETCDLEPGSDGPERRVRLTLDRAGEGVAVAIDITYSPVATRMAHAVAHVIGVPFVSDP